LARKHEKKQATRLSDLGAAPYNPRTIGAKELSGLGYSMAEFGDLGGVVFNERSGNLVAGHQRVKSLRQQYGDVKIVDGQIATPEGHSFSVRVVDWPLMKEKAANVAANATTIQGDFTADLDELVAEVSAEMPDFAEALSLDALVASVVDGDDLTEIVAEEDEVPSVDEQGPVHSKQGEVYELGPHRLLCGDCRDPEQWARLLQGELANVVFTSPPYASQRKYDESSGFKPIPPDEYGDWWERLQDAVREHLAEDGSFFVNIKEHCEDGQRHLYVKRLTIRMVDEWGWRFVDELCWERVGLPGRFYGRMKNAWEPVFHFCRIAPADLCFHPENSGTASDSIPVYSLATSLNPVGSLTGIPNDRDTSRKRAQERETRSGVALPSNRLPPFSTDGTMHSAAFPVGLPSFFIRAFSDPGDLIMDPFMGSGTTMIASAELGRRAAGFEISPRYCDVIRRRWTAWATKNNADPGPGALE